MKSRKLSLFTMLVAISLLLSACGSPATPTAAPLQPTSTTAAEPTKTPVPTAVPEATENDLDTAYSAFLANMDGYNILKVADLQKRLADEYQPSSADVTQKTKTFLLDVRETSEVEKNGHIQGAVNIPIRELAKNLNKLPGFESPIVVYCANDESCAIGMTALGALGWKDVYSLGEKSFAGWVEAGYQVMAGLPVKALARNEAKPNPSLVAAVDKALTNLPEGYGAVEAGKLKEDLAAVPGLVLIDVRSADEIKENGSIESANSLSIPLEELVTRRSEWPAEKSTPIVIYCDTGYKSAIAMQILQTYGYTDVRSLNGGLNAWIGAGMTVGKASP